METHNSIQLQKIFIDRVNDIDGMIAMKEVSSLSTFHQDALSELAYLTKRNALSKLLHPQHKSVLEDSANIHSKSEFEYFRA